MKAYSNNYLFLIPSWWDFSSSLKRPSHTVLYSAFHGDSRKKKKWTYFHSHGPRLRKQRSKTKGLSILGLYNIAAESWSFPWEYWVKEGSCAKPVIRNEKEIESSFNTNDPDECILSDEWKFSCSVLVLLLYISIVYIFSAYFVNDFVIKQFQYAKFL